jgi:hypothetical protein
MARLAGRRSRCQFGVVLRCPPEAGDAVEAAGQELQRDEAVTSAIYSSPIYSSL